MPIDKRFLYIVRFSEIPARNIRLLADMLTSGDYHSVGDLGNQRL